MKKLLLIAVGTFMLSVQPALAGIVGDVRVIGKVVKYDRKIVSLKTLKSSKPVVVPSSSIVLPEGAKLKTGKVVTAVFSAEEIMEKLKKAKQSQQQQVSSTQKK